MVDFDFDGLDTGDRSEVLLLNTRIAELLESREVRTHLDYLREVCSNRADFERARDERLAHVLGPLYKVHGADEQWLRDRNWALREDGEVAEKSQRVEELLGFGTWGPLKLAKGDCVEVSGLESDNGSRFNSQKGVVVSYAEDKGRYDVRLAPESLLQLRPGNLRRLDDAEKLLSVQSQALARLVGPEARAELDELRARCSRRELFDQARGERLAALLGPVCQGHGVDVPWLFGMAEALSAENDQVAMRRQQIEALASFCDPGPAGLDRGDCVEIQGLESDSGKQMNGKKGLVVKWIAEKGRYDICVSNDKVLTLKPENARRLGDLEKLRCVQKQAAEVLASAQAQAALDQHRRKSTNVMQYLKLSAKAVPQFEAEACKQLGVDLAWRARMLAAHPDDPITKAASKKIEELAGFGTLGPSQLEKGAFYEVFGLTSEAGQKINGTAVIIRGWDEAKGRYDVSPFDDLGEMKAMKPESLRPIPDRQFETRPEAAEFQQALREAYGAPAAQEVLLRLKAEHPSMKTYMVALRPALLEIQRPVLERFSFRSDFVGQNHMQRALAPHESDPEIAQSSRELERLLGLQELRFDGRVAIVTGGGRGLGRAYCKLLAARGAKVVVNNRTAMKADEVVAEITASGGTAVAEHSNIALGGDKVVAAALRYFGRIDIVVCNAGQLEDKRFVNMGLEEFTSVLNTHVVGHFRLLKAAWPHLLGQKYGRIVLISSEAGMHGHFGQLNYTAAKGALMSMGQTLAMEGYRDGVLTNVICTEGFTRMTNDLLPEAQRASEEELAQVKQSAAAPVAYLCHETCKATAGIFRVDGGHVQAFRWQSDEAFVDFEPARGAAGLEQVAEQWPERPSWQHVAYRGEGQHAHGFARAGSFA